MTDEPPEDVIELADTYLDTRGSDEAGVDIEEIEEKLEYWQDQVEEFEEGTPMHEMAVEERDKLQERYEGMSEQGERRAQLHTELLTRASTEFAPHGDWVDDTVVSALTHAVTGQQQDRILVGDHVLPDDADDLSKREIVTVAKNIHAVAEDAIDSNEALNDVWDKMSTDKGYPITKILVQEGSLIGSSDIRDQLDDDETDNPGANLRYVLNSSEYYPYYREEGSWTLSLLGEYAWQIYGPDAIEEDHSNGEGVDGDQQFSLDDVDDDDGGDSDE